MDKLFGDWQFSPAVPGIWSDMYWPALVLIACLNLISFYCIAKILYKNKRKPWVYKLGFAFSLASYAYGTGTPILSINAPIGLRNIMGSLGLCILLVGLYSGRIQVSVRDEDDDNDPPSRNLRPAVAGKA